MEEVWKFDNNQADDENTIDIRDDDLSNNRLDLSEIEGETEKIINLEE
jgi:hypothetical protein